MFLCNYHCHSRYCDGKGEMEEYILYALEKGFKALGFSSHAPMDGQDWTMNRASLPEYFAELEVLKKKYSGQLEIYTGLEIDYVDSQSNPANDYFQGLPLDFSIGSFHMMGHGGKYWAIDGPDDHFLYLLNQVYRGSIAAFAQGFYSSVGEMLKLGGFDILGHLDLIKKKNRDNRFFREDSPWYQNIIRKSLEDIARWGGIVEVNTGGISRGAIDSVYPSPWIINRAAKLGIPFTLNSDSHRPEHLDFHYKESLAILKEEGVKELMLLVDGKWQSFPMD